VSAASFPVRALTVPLPCPLRDCSRQNNWHVTMTAALALDDSFLSQLATHLFFFGNFVVMVIVFSNVVVSFIVDSYMFVVEQGEITPTKLDDSLKGAWAEARRTQVANASRSNPITLAVHRVMAGSIVMRNSTRKVSSLVFTVHFTRIMLTI